MKPYKKGNINLPQCSLCSRKKVIYSNTIITFDIEVTSAWIKDGHIINDNDAIPEKEYNELQPLSLCYIWQCSIENDVYYGRELKTFKTFLLELAEKIEVNFFIYVHNLAYEFQFLLNYFTIEKVFARSPHHPMKAIFKEVPTCEFRCSYILTRLSLANWGKKLGLPKMVGDLDYNIIRTPKTQLTEKELNYCERDCVVVYNGIKKELEEYKNIIDIPLTQTGKIRNIIKKMLTSEKGYLKRIAKLTPKNVEEYKILNCAYWGAYTHANMIHVGKILENVRCFDFASSYPFTMVTEKFPNTPFFYTEKILDDFEKYAYIIHVVLKNLKSKKYNHFLSESKCISTKNAICDNGRIMKADEVEIICTEQDYDIIKRAYNFDEKLVSLTKSRKGYLPKKLILYILELYGNKTSLKGIDEKKDIYAQSKEYINSLYGMMCTALLQDDIEFDGAEWSKKVKTKEEVEKYLEDITTHVKRKNFLSYAWGVWVTAYARHNLWECVLSCDHDVAYCDTDSIKCVGGHNFDWYNEKVLDKILTSATINNIDESLFKPKDNKGNEHIIGIFDEEPYYKEFITWGAKKYAYRSSEDNELHITVSGVPKGARVSLNNDIRNFKKDFKFSRSIEEKNGEKAVSQYLTYISDCEEMKVGYPDGYIAHETFGINMRRKSYQMGLASEFSFLIHALSQRKKLEVIEDIFNE